MSERAHEFMIYWLSVNVGAVPAVQRLGKAIRLATKCREDATLAGIALQEIRAVAEGDLIRKILAAFDAAACSEKGAVKSPELETAI